MMAAFTPRRIFWLLIASSVALRIALVLNGGTGYWPDENRFFKAWFLFGALNDLDLDGMLEVIFQSPDHTGFTLTGVFAVCFQATWIWLLGDLPDVTSIDASMWVSALPLSACSVASVALVHALARRTGASEAEALLAMLFAACANTLFYFARHLQPYDAALAWNLTALWIALSPRASNTRSLAAGLAAGLGFLTYNGYWLGAGLAGVVHVVVASSVADSLRRAAWFGAALIAPVVALTLLTWAAGETLFFVSMANFSQLARTQADFAEGWSLPFAYLWHTEHALALVFALGLVGSLALLQRGSADERRRAAVWVGGAVFVYGSLVLFSVGFERIGVFGRQVRQLVPFLCLASAAAAAAAYQRWPVLARPAVAGPVLAAVVLQAGWNFAERLDQTFPAEFARRVREVHGDLPTAVSLDGPNPRRPRFAGPVPFEVGLEELGPPRPRHLLLNAQHLYPVSGTRTTPTGRVVARERHPLEWLPYQLEGYTPAERAILAAADLSMRVVEVAPDVPLEGVAKPGRARTATPGRSGSPARARPR